MTAIPTVPVERITRGTDLFLCVPYSCKMPARSCVERQVQVREGLNQTAFKLCKGCELGAQVEKNSGVKITLEVDTLRNGQKRIRGRQAPNHPTPIPRALAQSLDAATEKPFVPVATVSDPAPAPATAPRTVVERSAPAAKAPAEPRRGEITMFRVEHGKPHPVPVRCAELDYKARDADGEQIYVATHFESEDAAWEQLARISEDAQKLAAGEYVEARARFQKATEDLAREAAFRSAVENAIKERTRAPRAEQRVSDKSSPPVTQPSKRERSDGPTAHIRAALAGGVWRTRAEILVGFKGKRNSLDATLTTMKAHGKVQGRPGKHGAQEYRTLTD